MRVAHKILNYHLLGNTDISIYEYGDNIDEPFQEYATLPDMQEHFLTVFETINNFDGLLFFELDVQSQ